MADKFHLPHHGDGHAADEEQAEHLAAGVDAAAGSGDGGQVSERSAAATALSTPSGAASGSVSKGASSSPVCDTCDLTLSHASPAPRLDLVRARLPFTA